MLNQRKPQTFYTHENYPLYGIIIPAAILTLGATDKLICIPPPSLFTGDGTRPSLTEICLAPDEFDHYQVGVDAAITFCLKELRVSTNIE